MPERNQQQIRELMQELRAELASAADQDPAKRERLERLMQNIDSRMEGRLEEDHQQELVAELREEAMEFEVEHPDVSATLRGFLNMLSTIGI